MNKKVTENNPSTWIGTLYLMQGLPYMVVTILSTLLFKAMGASNVTITTITSLFFLPWVAKPLLAPFIEQQRNKRQWTLAMEIIIGISLLMIGITLTSHHAITNTACLLGWIALCSTVHDISSDGVYLIHLNGPQQIRYIALRNASYQIARLLIQGLVVMIAARIMTRYSATHTWQWLCVMLGTVMITLSYWHYCVLPRPSLASPNASSGLRLSNARSIFSTWFLAPNAMRFIVFILLFNAGDACLSRIVPLFFLDPSTHHGLGMSLHQLGIIQTFGVMSFILGCIGLTVFLKHRALALTLRLSACALLLMECGYIALLVIGPHHILWCGFIYNSHQCIFGFANGAFMALIMQQACQTPFRTASFAFATATMSLSYLLFGSIGGLILHQWGYLGCFSAVTLISSINVCYTFYMSHVMDSDHQPSNPLHNPTLNTETP